MTIIFQSLIGIDDIITMIALHRKS